MFQFPSGRRLSWRRLVSSALSNIATLVRSRRLPRAIARTGRRAVRATPLPPLLRRAWAWVHEEPMRAKDVLWILQVLDTAEVHYRVAGGWGVDALAGRQTRRHHDLDLVILDFERDEARARSALAPLGFRLINRSREAGIWMPLRSVLDDDAGHRIEFLGIDEEQLIAGLRLPSTDRGHTRVDLGSSGFASGAIGRRTVACLSAEVQLLFHSGYELRSNDRRDAAMLLRLLGPY